MIIRDDKKIEEIQAEFTELFPGLKIEFYKIRHDEEEASKRGDQYHPSMTLENIRTGHMEGEFIVNSKMTVAELEREFEERFGLNVQVFRRSADLWLQTTATDGWTLEVQNRKGLHSLEALA